MTAGITAIVGAGPAGLTAAYELTRNGAGAVVLEADPERVGGISRTAEHGGFLFDIGGHRFFTKSAEIDALWGEILPAGEFLTRDRRSRILYGGELFPYPLRALETLRKLGPVESARCLFSYLRARLAPVREPANFEDWVANHFGRRLYEIFFKTYTEKVWGMPCAEISADWAAQRIKGLSLGKAVRDALFRRPGEAAAKTLITQFKYPRRGPGQLWAACADKVRAAGGEVRLGRSVQRCDWDAGSRRWPATAARAGGGEETVEAEHLISTAPLRALVGMLGPAPPPEVAEAAAGLRYRDFIVVALIVKDRRQLADHWIYVHEPGVKVGRVQNFKAWSPDMVPGPDLACYGMEYFCFEGDGLWSMPDRELAALAGDELVALGLAERGDLVDACVVRQPKAYPVYDDGYAGRVETLRAALAERYPTLHLAGRNGMHRYNNQDHSMMTALLCARNILAGEDRLDPWSVNEDAEYHEGGKAAEYRPVPGKLGRPG